MSRHSARLIQQTLEALSITQSELLTVQSESTATDPLVLSGSVNVFGVNIVNTSGVTANFRLYDDTVGAIKVNMGQASNNGFLTLTLTPNYIPFPNGVTIRKDNTGSMEWTILYQEA